jgi:hypothetical protein
MNKPMRIFLVTAALVAVLAACTPTTPVPAEEQTDLAATQAAMEKTQVAVANLQSELQQTQAALEQQAGAADSVAEQEAPAEAVEAEGGSEPESSLIDVVLQQTTQYKGDPDAPVKLIMFSDFQ